MIEKMKLESNFGDGFGTCNIPSRELHDLIISNILDGLLVIIVVYFVVKVVLNLVKVNSYRNNPVKKEIYKKRLIKGIVILVVVLLLEMMAVIVSVATGRYFFGIGQPTGCL